MSSNDTAPPSGQEQGSGASARADGDGPTAVERGWLRRHWIVTAVVVTALVVAGGVGGYLYYLDTLFKPSTVPLTLEEEDRPAESAGRDLNILLAGADNGSGKSIADEVAAGTWTPGEHRSDTIMVLHVPAHRKRAFLISIPRDSYVQIYDENGEPAGMDKINAAFAAHGPSGYIATVEELTNLRMDHLAIMDWNGFTDLSTAVGGVEVCIAETFTDQSQDITWERGCREIEGKEALAYVRTRYGLENGDFDRIQRQQNFIRSLMSTVLENESRFGVNGITHALRAMTENLTVDEDWDTREIRRLALSMRDLDSDDVTFLTAPLERYDTTDDGQSIVVLDRLQSRALWRSVKNDQVSKYVRRYGDESGVLGDAPAIG